MRSLPGERTLDPKRVAFFIERLKQRDFGSPTWSSALIGDDPEPWRCDGQHTSTALTQCDESIFPKDLNVTLTVYHLQELGDASPLFERFDNPNSTRKSLDRLNTYIAKHPEVRGINPKFLSKVLGGIHYLYSEQARNTNGKTKGRTVRKFKLPTSRDWGVYLEDPQVVAFAVCANRWSEAPHAFMIGKPGITAEIFEEWKAQPEKAIAFWDEVITESNLNKDDATRVLARLFQDLNHRKPPTRQERFRKEAKAIWKSYRAPLAGAA